MSTRLVLLLTASFLIPSIGLACGDVPMDQTLSRLQAVPVATTAPRRVSRRVVEKVTRGYREAWRIHRETKRIRFHQQ